MSQLRPFKRLTATLLIVALLLLTSALSMTARGAAPGAELLSFSGSLGGAVPSRAIVLAESGQANLRLAVSGGAGGDLVSLELLDPGGAAVPGASWSARSGETIWATTVLTAGGRLRMSTASAGLSVDLKSYARGTVLAPTEAAAGLSGRLIGAEATTSGTQVELSVPAAGLYRLALGAESGGYQLVVGDGYLRKTVIAGQVPAAEDTTYYLPAGNHRFQIIADSTGGAQTAWSFAITRVGAIDSLPYAEATARLGSSLGRGAFTEERVPIQLSAGAEVNLRISVTGGAGDKLQVELLNGETVALTVAPVAGGETVWATGRLAAGANALRVVAPSTLAAPLAYSLQIVAIGQPELTLAGSSQGASTVNSTVRVTLPAAGLYRFTLAASAGRFQLRLNDTYLRRIVGSAGSEFTAFIPAGTHQLVVDQESGGGATWSATIAAAGESADALPFVREGATLGGAGNDFVDERLPIAFAAATPVNIRITTRGGDGDDKLRFDVVRPGADPVFTVATIFGGADPGEVTWATATLTAGDSLLRVSAEGNTEPMAYEVAISAIPAAPASWSGVSRGVGLSSQATFTAPEDGIYTITLTLASGAGQIVIADGGAAAPQLAGAPADTTTLVQRVPLKAGPHRFTLEHDRGQPTTSWTVAVALARATPTLALKLEQPLIVVAADGGVVTVPGTGFLDDTQVELIDGAGAPLGISYKVLSSTAIQLTVPAGLPGGSYLLRVRGADGSVVEAADAVLVASGRVYLPVVRR